MKQLVIAERFCLIGHIVSRLLDWQGLLLVVPHAEVILNLAAGGRDRHAVGGGGVADILMGTAAVSIYAYRTLGLLDVGVYAASYVSLIRE